MLLRPQFVEVDHVTLGDIRQQPVAVIVLTVVIQAFLVDGHESGFD